MPNYNTDSRMLLRYSVWILKGKPIQSLFYFLLITVTVLTFHFGILFTATRDYIQSQQARYYCVRVEPKDPQGGLSRDVIETIFQNPKIKGFNFSCLKSVKPDNFISWVDYYQGSKTDADAELSVNMNVEFADVFVNNTAKLVKGAFPSKKIRAQ